MTSDGLGGEPNESPPHVPDYSAERRVGFIRALPVCLVVCTASAIAAFLALAGISGIGLGEPFYGADRGDWLLLGSLTTVAALALFVSGITWLWILGSALRARRASFWSAACLVLLLAFLVWICADLVPEARFTLEEFWVQAPRF